MGKYAPVLCEVWATTFQDPLKRLAGVPLAAGDGYGGSGQDLGGIDDDLRTAGEDPASASHSLFPIYTVLSEYT